MVEATTPKLAAGLGAGVTTGEGFVMCLSRVSEIPHMLALIDSYWLYCRSRTRPGE
jgi:hypothetical protein